jgi:DNA-binding MarR family transcriptional regulator
LNEEQADTIIKQNEVIISLLGRIAYKPKEILDIVTLKKRNPDRYIEGYNACDGNHSLSEIAEIVGVDQGTLSPILSKWEEIGIVYETAKPGGKFCRKLYPI